MSVQEEDSKEIFSVFSYECVRFLFEHHDCATFIHDEKGHFLEINARSCSDLGYTREELLALSIRDITVETPEAERSHPWSKMPAGAIFKQQEIAKRKDGSFFPVEIVALCQRVEGRNIFIGFARDKTPIATSIQKNDDTPASAGNTSTFEITEDKLRNVIDSAYEAIAFQDREGRYLLFNRAAENFTGILSSEVIGKTSKEVFGSLANEATYSIERQVLATGEICTVEEELALPVGNRIFLTTRSPYRDRTGQIQGLVTVARDITEIKAAQKQIAIKHERLAMAARVGGLGIWDFDIRSGRLYCDERWYRIMGRSLNQPIRTVDEFKAIIHPEDVERATEVDNTVEELIRDNRDYEIIFRILWPNGEVRTVRSVACLTDVVDGNPTRAVGFVIDVTEMQHAEEKLKAALFALEEANQALSLEKIKLESLSLHDGLTGIINRRGFDKELKRAFKDALRTREPLAIALIDVDCFKQYNDLYGHVLGDEALCVVAQTLNSVLKRPADIAARYGGEEFALLFPDTSNLEHLLREACEKVALLGLPHAGSNVASHLTISCGGIVATTFDGLNPKELIVRCDTALYRAKQSGRNRFVLW